MKAYKYIVLIFVIPLFINGSCENPKDRCFITIQNNSNNEVVFVGSFYSSVSEDSLCFKPITGFEYKDFIHDKVIKPHSIKKMEIEKEYIQEYNSVLSLGIFNRIDMDTMSCEEFKQIYPLKKEWNVTFADLEAANWTLVYTPEE